MPRSNLPTRGIVLVAVSGLTLLLAACTPPLPPDVLAAQAEKNIACQKGDQPVGVDEAFAGSMMLVSEGLQGACPDQTVSEVTLADNAPIQIVDHAPTAEEQAAFTASSCPTGTVIVTPAFAYPVGVAFNIIGLEGLVLTPDAIAGILSGTITSWEDPAITGPNEGYDLSGLPDIAVVSLDTPSGSVEAMTTWLSQAAPQAWTQGPTGTLSVGTQVPTDMDLVGELTAMEGTLAIVPVFLAVNNAIPVASLPAQDIVLASDDTQLMKVGAGATAITTDASGNLLASPAVGGVPVEGNFDLAASKVVLASGQPLIGWPVLGYAHMLVCDDPAKPLPLSTAQYIVRLAGQGALETFGVTPLPEPIRFRTFAPLKVTAAPPTEG